MKKYILMLLLPVMMFGQTGEEIAKMIDERPEPNDMTSEMSMLLTSKKGKTRSMKVHSIRKGDDKMIIWFLAPADDRGVAFLKLEHPGKDDEMRMWLPSFGKMRRIASSKKGESFMGSDLSYEDMTSRAIDEYTYEVLGEEQVDSTDAWVLKSIPNKELKSSYGYHKSWVRMSDAVVLKEESYNRGGKLQKTRDIEFSEIDGYIIFTRMFVKDVIKNHSTEMTFENIKINTDVDDGIFHERNLRRLP